MAYQNLQARWNNLWENRQIDLSRVKPLWEELEKAYAEKGRYYHNLQHLSELFQWFDRYQAELENPELVALAIWYHDVVYKIIGAEKNELRSAELAVERLQALGLSTPELQTIYHWIIATKTHRPEEKRDHPDARYFLDFDLAILGSPREKYALYAQQIRKEYGIYPDFMYRKGRKKVLENMLEAEPVFLTKKISELLEEQAKKNLNWELENL